MNTHDIRPRAVPFASMKRSGATRFVRLLHKNRELFPSITLVGAWYKRRFVIATLRQGLVSITNPISDYETLTLTLPNVNDPEFYVTECSRFGASIEAQFRKEKSFDRATSLGDAKTHVVHAHHHVALCGHRGPWPDGNLIDTESFDCEACADEKATSPHYRARYRPS